MKKIVLLILFLSLNIFANNEEIVKIQGALRAELTRLEKAKGITIEDVDGLANQFIAYLVRIIPTDSQLVNFKTRLSQVLERVPTNLRLGRTIEAYERQYLDRAARASLHRASLSMQRAQSVSIAVTGGDAWGRIYADYLPIQRNNGRTVASRATVLRTILGVLAGDNQQRLELLQGSRLQNMNVEVGGEFLRFVMKEIDLAMNAGQTNPDAPRAFEARMQGLQIYAQRLNLSELLNQVRALRDMTTSSVRYQALLGDAQQRLDRAWAARSRSRVPQSVTASTVRNTYPTTSRANAEERSLEDGSGQPEEVHAGFRRPREEVGRFEHPTPRNTYLSAPRAALSIVPGVLPHTMNIRVIDNSGGGDCLFYALGTTRAAFTQAVAANRSGNQNLVRVFVDGIASNLPDFTSWIQTMNAADETRRLGDEYEVVLWHALTGIPVRIFHWNAESQTWDFRTSHSAYANQQTPERWIGYNGDGENGHWVELQSRGTTNGNIQLPQGGNSGGSSRGFGGLFPSLFS